MVDMKNSTLIIAGVSILVVGGFFFVAHPFLSSIKEVKPSGSLVSTREGEPEFFLKNISGFDLEDLTASSGRSKTRTQTTPSGSSTNDTFSSNSIIEEINAMSLSTSNRWWVNSGGRFIIADGLGKTIQGDLPAADPWYKEYVGSSPEDTDNGLHPQNIFRLVEKESWKSYTQQFYFNINKMNLSASPNRNASNGVFLFNRYQSGDNLYYTGIRVDGAVVIKKKYQGVYYTMAYKKILSGTYDLASSPNLLPVSRWYGVKSQLKDLSDGSVEIKFFTDEGKTGTWTEVLSVIDKPGLYGSAVISNAGYAGIRTDFMDVSFDDYLIKSL